MEYVGLIVFTRPGEADRCARALRGQPDLEVHHVVPERHRIVAVLECPEPGGGETRLHEIRELPGVVAVHPAYLMAEPPEPEPSAGDS